MISLTQKSQANFEFLLIQCDKIRQNPDSFQKLCQVAISIIQGINWVCQSQYLSQCLKVLDVANVNDFYNIIQYPYAILYQIKPVRIDEYLLLEDLENICCKHWHIGTRNHKGKWQDPQLHSLIQTTLKNFLEELSENDKAYRHASRFKEALLHRLKQNHSHYDFRQINLEQLEIPLKPFSILKIISAIGFGLFDISCMYNFLNEWKVISLEKCAYSLGRFRGFAWLSDHFFDQWVVGAFTLSFLFQFLEAFRVLHDRNSTKNQKFQAGWDFVVSGSEFVLNFTIFRKGTLPSIILLTGIVKSIGLISALYKPQNLFFDR